MNKDKYDIKRGKWGSSAIYSVEYKCTSVEINVTTKSIITVSWSKQKDQFISKVAKWNHLVSKILKTEPVYNK